MKVVVYDRTCIFRRGFLTPAWSSGTLLYRALGRIDRAQGVASWDEAIAWLAGLNSPISELQYWGHGRWGRAMVDTDVLDGSNLDRLAPIREQLADSLVWFRTCETFGAAAGHDFAQRIADYLGARVAGHTYVIGFHQSGLHGLLPGMRPTWAADEGIAKGSAESPEKAKSSRPWAPNTITCLRGAVPDGWFA